MSRTRGLDRLSEIRARVLAATPGPWEPMYEETDSGHLFIWEVRMGAGVVAGAVEFDAHTTDADAELVAHAAADLRWAVEEIDYLRRSNEALWHLASALDGVVWALEEPGPGRLERRRGAAEEARQALCAIPIWREGECRSGCRRYATRELVIERDGEIRREPRCQECGSVKAAARRAAIADGLAPAALVRLEPIAQLGTMTEGGGA